MAVAIIPEMNDNHNPDTRSEQQDSGSANTVLPPGSRRVSQDLQWVEGVYDLVNRDAHEANSLGFSSWIFTQVSLPYQDPGKHGSKAWVRRNGDITMTLTPAVRVDDNGDISLEYPFGKYPRLILPWITTQVVRCQADIDNDGTLTLPVADSLRAFMEEIGQSWGGKSGRSFPRVSGDEPTPQAGHQWPIRFPRVSGDEPTYGERTAYERMFSPRERG